MKPIKLTRNCKNFLNSLALDAEGWLQNIQTKDTYRMSGKDNIKTLSIYGLENTIVRYYGLSEKRKDAIKNAFVLANELTSNHFDDNVDIDETSVSFTLDALCHMMDAKYNELLREYNPFSLLVKSDETNIKEKSFNFKFNRLNDLLRLATDTLYGMERYFDDSQTLEEL